MLNNQLLKNYVICIGCNYNGSLSGCVNDSIAMYNTLSKLNPEKIYLLNDDSKPVTTDILGNILKEIHENSKFSNYKIIITFAGHGHVGGKIQLSDKIIDYYKLYELINHNSKKLFELLLILDCCYSGGFVNLKSFGKISNIEIITSCNSSQKSSESTSCQLKLRINKIKNFIPIKNCFYIGVFTYNFTNILDQLILEEKDLSWQNIFSDNIWDIIDDIADQTYQIK
jgi:hypothetical protein